MCWRLVLHRCRHQATRLETHTRTHSHSHARYTLSNHARREIRTHTHTRTHAHITHSRISCRRAFVAIPPATLPHSRWTIWTNFLLLRVLSPHSRSTIETNFLLLFPTPLIARADALHRKTAVCRKCICEIRAMTLSSTWSPPLSELRSSTPRRPTLCAPKVSLETSCIDCFQLHMQTLILCRAVVVMSILHIQTLILCRAVVVSDDVLMPLSPGLELARELDRKVADAWLGHRQHILVPNVLCTSCRVHCVRCMCCSIPALLCGAAVCGVRAPCLCQCTVLLCGHCSIPVLL